MSYVYAVRVHNNDAEFPQPGSDEYEMTVGEGVDDLSAEAAQLRLLEALNINVHALAESAERIAEALEKLARFAEKQ